MNGVLRNFIRNRDSYSIDELAKNDIERMAFIYNQPTWLLEHWLKTYGEEETIGLCTWFNERPKLTARINTLKGSVADGMAAFEKPVGRQNLPENCRKRSILHVIPVHWKVRPL